MCAWLVLVAHLTAAVPRGLAGERDFLATSRCAMCRAVVTELHAEVHRHQLLQHEDGEEAVLDSVEASARAGGVGASTLRRREGVQWAVCPRIAQVLAWGTCRVAGVLPRGGAELHPAQ